MSIGGIILLVGVAMFVVLWITLTVTLEQRRYDRRRREEEKAAKKKDDEKK